MEFQANTSVFLIGMLILEVIVLFLIVSPEGAAKAREIESGYVEDVLWEERERRASRFANHYFKKHFIDSGFVEEAKNAVIPRAEAQRRANLETFLPQLWIWVEERLQAFWGAMYSVYYRLYIVVFIAPFAAVIAVPAVYDGLMERQRRIAKQGVATAVYFHGAKKVLTVLAIAPLLLLFLPMAISPMIWFVWMAGLPIALWVALSNVQEL